MWQHPPGVLVSNARVETTVVQLPEGIATAVIYVLLIAMLLVRPQGLFGKAS